MRFPTWVDRRSFTITDIAAVLAGDLGPNTRRHFERSWKRTASALRALDVDIAIKGDPDCGPRGRSNAGSSSS